jgi:GNAT superfamily N-acetyltransferase
MLAVEESSDRAWTGQVYFVMLARVRFALMTIRPATAEDVPHVLPMVDKVEGLHETWDPAKYGFRDKPSRMYHKWLIGRTTDPRSVFLVAEREGRLVAFLVGTVDQEIPIYRIKEYGFIQDLWVEEDYRHEGIARQMVMLAIEKFRQFGVKQIRLDTAAANEPARKLFSSCGFRPSTIEMLLDEVAE